MSWKVIISPEAEKDLDNLENEVEERIKEKLSEIKDKADSGIDPEHYLKWINKYEIHRLRVGDFRAFTDFDNENKEIQVLAVMKRDDAYTGWG